MLFISHLNVFAQIQSQISGRVIQTSISSLDEAIINTDVLYVTRMQKERFESEAIYNSLAGSYCVDANTMSRAKEGMVVMHPLPRVTEIHTEVDKDPRAAYFRQMENGMYMRMAILSKLILGYI